MFIRNKKTECYECDCCQEKAHKQCMTLQPSEIKVIPLQKRSLLFLCDTCRGIIKKMPFIIKTLANIQDEVKEINNKIDKYETKIEAKNDINIPTYAAIANNKVEPTKKIKNIPNLIIRPKAKQNAEKTKKDLQDNIKPEVLKVGVKNTRTTKNGGVIIKCDTKEDIEKLQKEAEKTLN